MNGTLLNRRGVIFAGCFASLFYTFTCCSQSHYEVGVLALRGHEQTEQAWQPTIDWLNQQIPNAEFTLQTYSFDALEHAFNDNALDFILTSPGQATTFARQAPLHWLATQKTLHDAQISKGLGAVVLVRHDSDFHTIADLEKAKVGAISEKAFGGFLALRYELAQQGYEHNPLFEHLQFGASSTDMLLHNVVNHTLDAAIVPVCTLERMVDAGDLVLSDFRALHQKYHSGFTCLATTALYPNWTFAKTERVPMGIGKQVTQALLAMPSDSPAAKYANNVGWTLPESKLQIDNVYTYFDLHPWQKTVTETAKIWLYQHPYIALLMIAVLLFSNIYHVWLEYKFKRSQRELHATLAHLRHKNTLLEHAQRIMIVGELGSSLAHEINQPLSAIQNYSQGAKIRVEQGNKHSDILPVLEKIQQQVTVASRIIQRLRKLIHKQPLRKAPCQLTTLVDETIALVHHGFSHHHIQLQWHVVGQSYALIADDIGLQQLLLNLLNNAKDACIMVAPPCDPMVVTVTLAYTPTQVQLTVSDNGVGLHNDGVPLEQAFYTTKQDGLGLGLAICRDIVEAHNGTMVHQQRLPNGCQVVVTLPMNRENKEEREHGTT